MRTCKVGDGVAAIPLRCQARQMAVVRPGLDLPLWLHPQAVHLHWFMADSARSALLLIRLPA
eukprot:3485430-Prorocentrum_lima.AAC.1